MLCLERTKSSNSSTTPASLLDSTASPRCNRFSNLTPALLAMVQPSAGNNRVAGAWLYKPGKR